MRWLRAGVVGALLALVLVAAPARAQEFVPDDATMGYPPDWPGVECPASVDSRDLSVVYFTTGTQPGASDEQARKLTCKYVGGVRLIAEYRLPEYTGDIDWCGEKDEDEEFRTQHWSKTHHAWVESEFGPSTNAILADLLSAAETLAKPCGSAVPSSSAPAAQRPCAIEGTVTAPDASPVEGIDIDIDGPGRIELAQTSTDAKGRFHFDALTGTDQFAVERDDVEVVARLRDPGSTWELWHERSPAGVRTKPFKVSGVGPMCKVDIYLGALDELAGANPKQDDRWPAMIAMTRRLVRMSRFVADPKGLGFTMDHELPVEVYAWCAGKMPVDCPTKATATAAEGAPFFRGGADPHIVLGPDESAAEGIDGCESDTIGHEWGHAVTADLFGIEIPHPAGRTNHAGYYGNPSSNDSWTEAFASYLGMEGRKHEGGSRLPRFVICGAGAAKVEYERSYKAWTGDGTYEEWAIAGVLLDVEDGAADYQVAGAKSLVDRDTALLVLPGPKGKVVVGRVLHPVGLDVRVQVSLLNGAAVVSSGQAEVDADGWFYFPVPNDVPAFASVRAYGIRGGGNGADDDPLDATPKQVWNAIAGFSSASTEGGRPAGVTGVFDVADLHGALHAAFSGDRDRNSIDDVEQLFRDHGLFADPEGDRTFQPGATIGRTDRPLAGGGASVDRYDVVLPPATHVRVDAGDADAHYIVSTTYPPDEEAGDAYVAVPDADGRIVVAVPGEDSGATVTVLAIAPGRLPTIVDVLEPAAFWKDAAAHGDEPFLELSVSLPEGDLDASGSESSAPPIALGGGLLALGIALAFVGRKRTPVLLVAVALAGGGIGVGAWSVLAGDATSPPGTEVALAADPDLADATTTTDEVTTISTSTSTSTTTVTTAAPTDDPDAVLFPAQWSASSSLEASGGTTYDPAFVGDGDRSTAWCVAGDGAGQSITATFDAPTAVTVLGMVPGYDKGDRWDANRRVVAATWSFDDGSSRPAPLGPERDMQYQAEQEPIVTRSVTLTIDRTEGPSDTCISEIELRGHPA